MENSAKALIIAGTIYIVIILISLSTVILNGTKIVIDQINDTLTSYEKVEFNRQFDDYTGDQISASKLKKLLGIIRINNINNKDYRYIEIIDKSGKKIDIDKYEVRYYSIYEVKITSYYRGCISQIQILEKNVE